MTKKIFLRKIFRTKKDDFKVTYFKDEKYNFKDEKYNFKDEKYNMTKNKNEWVILLLKQKLKCGN